MRLQSQQDHNSQCVCSQSARREGHEQNKELYVKFVDLIKAFDTVNRKEMWQIMEQLSCPTRILNTLIQQHENQRCQVILIRNLIAPFPIFNEVKKGGVLAAALFTIFKQTIEDSDDGIGVYVRYHLVDSLFNLRLQANTNTLKQLIRDVSFVNDTAQKDLCSASLLTSQRLSRFFA